MVNAVMKIEKFEQSNSSFSIAVSFAPEKEVKSPRVAIVFSCEKENRRLPMETSVKDGVVKIDSTQCNGCGLCANVCPFGAIEKED